MTEIRIHRRSASGHKSDQIKDFCPFRTTKRVSGYELDGACSIDVTVPCRYGLTEIYLPKGCPLRAGPVTTVVRIRR